MRRRAEPGSALAALLPLLILAAAGAPAARASPPGEDDPVAAPAAPSAGVPTERQLLVVLRTAHESLWRGFAREASAFHGLELLRSWTMESLGEQCLVFAVPPGGDRDAALARLARDRRVVQTQPVARFHTLESPWNDTYAPLQPALSELGLAAAHRVATGRGVAIALVDTGVDFEHPDLAAAVRSRRSFVDGGEESFARDVHGTAVAGVLAAGAGNGLGIVGIAPGAEVAALKACWSEPPGARAAVCDSYSLARALDFALIARARILNLSLAGPHDPLLARLIERAEERGVLVVAAADPTGASPFPADLATVLAVAAAGDGGHAALAAPGADLLSTGPLGAYDFFSGSSFATAEVAGVAALLLERRPELAPAALRELLIAGARPPAVAGALPTLDACGALAAALGRDACAEGAAPRP